MEKLSLDDSVKLSFQNYTLMLPGIICGLYGLLLMILSTGYISDPESVQHAKGSMSGLITFLAQIIEIVSMVLLLSGAGKILDLHYEPVVKKGLNRLLPAIFWLAIYVLIIMVPVVIIASIATMVTAIVKDIGGLDHLLDIYIYISIFIGAFIAIYLSYRLCPILFTPILFEDDPVVKGAWALSKNRGYFTSFFAPTSFWAFSVTLIAILVQFTNPILGAIADFLILFLVTPGLQVFTVNRFSYVREDAP